MLSRACSCCLKATLDEIQKRLGGANGRRVPEEEAAAWLWWTLSSPFSWTS